MQQAEGFGKDSLWQDLGCNRRAGSGSNEKSVLEQMEKCSEPSIALTAGRTGTWTEDEDSKLKDAVRTHGSKNWVAISALVSGGTKSQCRNRWQSAVNPSKALTAGRTGKWTEDEDSKLKDVVHIPTVARIGPRFPRWFLVARDYSVRTDGIST
jgi:protein involved in temperature-dependent protein secretion